MTRSFISTMQKDTFNNTDQIVRLVFTMKPRTCEIVAVVGAGIVIGFYALAQGSYALELFANFGLVAYMGCGLSHLTRKKIKGMCASPI